MGMGATTTKRKTPPEKDGDDIMAVIAPLIFGRSFNGNIGD